MRLLFTILLLWATILVAPNQAADCPCSEPEYCQLVKYDEREVFGYVLESDATVWATFNWTKLTTISMVDFFDQKLVCLAHQNNVSVLTRETFSLTNLDNATYVNNWILEKLKLAKTRFVDGINLFVDDPVPEGDKLVGKLTDFVKQVSDVFHATIPGSKVIFNVPFSPYNEQKNGVDGKNYDYAALSKVADQLFVMDYDQRKQSFEERCVAGATSNFYYTLGGILAYTNMSVQMNKLVLGVPFYAKDYECVDYAQNMRCYVQPYQYRGSKCSSLVATDVPYNKTPSLTAVFFDEHSSSHYGYYIDGSYGILHQVWYDTCDNTQLKFQLTINNAMRGIGMWTLNAMAKQDWNCIPDYKGKPIAT